jgi:hypothetical protein
MKAWVGSLFLVAMALGCIQLSVQRPDAGPIDWRTAELTDVISGEKFKVSDFEGKTVLLESFAVWCPTCLEQQRRIAELRTTETEMIHISLDTDPNEDETRVREHLTRYGFDWYFAVAPSGVTRSLIDEFGLGVVNAPSAPVVLVCEDLSARFLPGGLKSVDKLKEEIARGC